MSRPLYGGPRHGIARGWGRVMILVGAMWGLVQTSPAVAAPSKPVRYDRPPGKVETRQTLSTRVGKAKKDAAKQQKRKPTLNARDFGRKQKAAATQAITDDQIALMKRLIRAAGSRDPKLPDYYFRLADLHLDKKAYFELQAGALFEKIHAAKEGKKPAEAKRLRAKQVRFQGQAKKMSRSAAAAYAELARNKAFAKYKRLDEVLYYLAFEYGQLGEEKPMQRTFMRLIRDFPRTRFLAHAYVSFADFYYDKGRIADALKLYEQVITGYSDSPVYAYALYKSAWCYLNPVGSAPAEYSRSLQRFVDTIGATRAGKAGSQGNARQLRRDARRDLVRAYVHSGRPSKAWRFFDKVGNGPTREEDMAVKMMELLADAYFGEGKYVESSAVYKVLQSEFAASGRTCGWQAKVVINALATDDQRIQLRETDRLAEYWEKFRDTDHKAKVRKKCRDDARDTLVHMATVWHDEASKTNRPQTFASAEHTYRRFLDLFPDDREAYEMRYYFAEILWAQAVDLTHGAKTKAQGREKFKASHEAFVAMLRSKPKGKHTKAAAFAQMLAMKNYFEYDETAAPTRGCRLDTQGVCVPMAGRGRRRGQAEDNHEVTEYSADEQAMLTAYATYQKYVDRTDDPELPKILYHRARLMVAHNRYDQAEPVLQQLVKRFDGSQYAAWSAEMLVDMLTIRWRRKGQSQQETDKAGDRLERTTRALAKRKLWRRDEAARLRKQAPTLLAAIGWVKAEGLRERGTETKDPELFVACGEKFQQVFNEHADHPRADALLFNAAKCYQAGYRVGYAISLRNKLLELYPDSEHAKETLHEVANNYQAIAWYDRAADRFEQYASKYRDKNTGDALQNAYLFRLGLGEDAKAQVDLDRYEALYRRKNPKRAATIFWSKHALLKDPDRRLTHALEYIKTYGKKGGADRLAVAHAVAGQVLWRRSCPRLLLGDSCVTVKRKRAAAGSGVSTIADDIRREVGKKIPKYCGSETQALIRVYPRDKKQAAAARKHFGAVARLSSTKVDVPGDETGRQEAFMDARGMAMVYLADADYETYLALQMPDKLELYVDEWMKDYPQMARRYRAQVAKREASLAKFNEYYAEKNRLGAKLLKAYADVQKSGSRNWVLAAAARAATLSQNFADQLYRAPVPRTIKTEEMYDGYCDEIAKYAAKPQQAARKALRYCLQRSTEFSYFNEFSRMCEDELQQVEPTRYPATNELFGTAVYTDSRLDRVGVQLRLDAPDQIGGKARPGPAKTAGSP